jgi:hypothetical protein
MSNYQRASGIGEESLQDLGRRLGAAFVSYMHGYKGVDRALKQAPEKVGAFWVSLADALFCAMKDGAFTDDQPARDVLTKYIQ